MSTKNINLTDGNGNQLAPATTASQVQWNSTTNLAQLLNAFSGGIGVASTVSAMTDTTKIYVYTGSESGYTSGNWYYYNGSAWTSGGEFGGASIDDTLSISGMAADAGAVGDAIGDLSDLETTDQSNLVAAINEATQSGGSGLTADIKTALLQIAEKVAYIDANGQDYYDDLYDAFYPNLSSITATYTQSGTVYESDSLSDLTSDLVVTANYSDGTTETLSSSDYTLSGTLSSGTSTITVTYGAEATTFSVTVTADSVTGISAVYTQSGTVYDTDSLSDLTDDLVVVATYTSGNTETLTDSDYTLSGTLSSGTCTITVTYGNFTATFTVTVTLDTTAQLDTDHMNYGQNSTFGSYTSKTNFCPTIKYPISTSLSSGYDYFKGIIPVDAVASSTCRAWTWADDSSGTSHSGYGTGKPMQVYSDSMTEGQISWTSTSGYIYLTIPVHVDYLDDAYLYINSTGDVLFAGKNTPYFGMSNISEAS